MPFRKIFFRFEHLGPLQMANLGRKLFDAGSQQRQRRGIGRVAIALHDLIGDRVRRQPKLGTDVRFHFRPLMRERAHRAGKLADGDLLPNLASAAPDAGTLPRTKWPA